MVVFLKVAYDLECQTIQIGPLYLHQRLSLYFAMPTLPPPLWFYHSEKGVLSIMVSTISR